MVDLYSFVMRGLLTEEALDRSGRKRKSNFADMPDIELVDRLGLNLMDASTVELSRRMSLVYTAICSFENSVRDFVSKKMLEEVGADWWEKNVNADVRNRAKHRKEAENSTKWLSPRGEDIINYTEFGDLISIISNNFKFFEPHVGTLDWVRSIILPLEKMRHIIMHSGELDSNDIERVGINIRDWINQVGG